MLIPSGAKSLSTTLFLTVSISCDIFNKPPPHVAHHLLWKHITDEKNKPHVAFFGNVIRHPILSQQSRYRESNRRRGGGGSGRLLCVKSQGHEDGDGCVCVTVKCSHRVVGKHYILYNVCILCPENKSKSSNLWSFGYFKSTPVPSLPQLWENKARIHLLWNHGITIISSKSIMWCIRRLKINDLGCCSWFKLTSEPDGEMGTRSAGEEGRPRSMSNGSSRLGLFFFSVSRSLISPEPWLWPSARVRTPDKKSAISSCRWVREEIWHLGHFWFHKLLEMIRNRKL